MSAPAALATSDTSGPLVVAVTAIPNTVDVTTGPASITISVQLTDQTGVQDGSVFLGRIGPVTGGTLQSEYVPQPLVLSSGTPQSGTWSTTFTFARHEAIATVGIYLDAIRDGVGNYSDLSGYVPKTFSLIYTPDSDPPTVEARGVTPGATDVATGSATVTASLQLSDATGAKAPVAHLYSPSGTQMAHATMRLTSGGTREGTWTSPFTLAQGAPGGTWKITATDIDDTDGNTSFTNGDELVLGTTVVTNITAGTPTISGTARVGSRVSVNPGAWVPSSIALAYQWSRVSSSGDATPIPGATGTDYTPQPADLGHWLSVRVAGAMPGHAAVTRTASTSTVVTLGGLRATRPTISGTVSVGSRVTADPGLWGPAPVALTYQWFRVSSASQGVAIRGATAQGYLAQPADRGYRLAVRITGSRDGYATAASTAATAAKVAAGSLTGPAPTISGPVKRYATLTASPGAWGPAPVSLTYQWFRVGSNGSATLIRGATAPRYTVQAADHGYRLRVCVTGRKVGYDPATRAATTTVRA